MAPARECVLSMIKQWTDGARRGSIFGSPLCPQAIGQEEMNAKLLHNGFAALHMVLRMEVAGNASDAAGSY